MLRDAPMMSLRIRYRETTETAAYREAVRRNAPIALERLAPPQFVHDLLEVRRHAHGAVVLEEHEGEADGKRNPVLPEVGEEKYSRFAMPRPPAFLPFMVGMEDREFRTLKQYYATETRLWHAARSAVRPSALLPRVPIPPDELVEPDPARNPVEARNDRKQQQDEEKGQHDENGNQVRVRIGVQPGNLVPDRVRPQPPGPG